MPASLSKLIGLLPVLTLAAFVAACGERTVETEAAPRAGDAAVRVLNRTASDVEVEANHQLLGVVAAGEEQVFGGLAPGTFDLRGRSSDGALVFRRDLLSLEAGETFTWILREGGLEPAAADAGAAPANLGRATLVVENGTGWDVALEVDGRPLGTVRPKTTSRFDDIEPGARRLVARAEGIRFPEEFPVLEPGETFTWRLRPAPGVQMEGSGGILPAPGTGRLRVENAQSVPLVVLANGTPLGTVEAGRTRIFDELPAQRMLLAAETRDGQRIAGPSTRIEPGRVTLWRIDGGRVSDVSLLPGRPDQPAPDEVTQPLPPEISARPPAPPPLPVAPPGPAIDEPLPAPAAPAPARELEGKTFVVENRTSQDLQVLLDGVSIGAVGAGMTQRFSSLPALRFKPSAVTASGRQEFTHPVVDLSTRQTFTWIIEP